jgi:hypothetical protein
MTVDGFIGTHGGGDGVACSRIEDVLWCIGRTTDLRTGYGVFF